MIGKLLTGETHVREYTALRIDGEIRERVYLECGGMLVDVSARHWLLSLEPMVFGVWMDGAEPLPAMKPCKMYFYGKEGMAAKDLTVAIRLKCSGELQDGKGRLMLLTLMHAELFHMAPLKARLIYWRYYRKPYKSYGEYKSLIAAFSFPRRVRLISFRDGDYYNIFPMDLIGAIDGERRMVFGLRHSNRSLTGMAATGRFAVADVSYDRREAVYGLGRHHSTAPPSIVQLPFGIIHSREGQCYLPDWVEGYREMSVLATRNLGSHMLIWAAWEKEYSVNLSADHLHHVHFLHWLTHRKRDTAC